MAGKPDAAGTVWEQPGRGERVAIWGPTVRCLACSALRSRAATGLAHDRLARPAVDLPEVELEGGTTKPPWSLDAKAIIALYAKHGTNEQFRTSRPSSRCRTR